MCSKNRECLSFLLSVRGQDKEYAFDGEIRLWSFTLERPAKRSDVLTGTFVGQTIILENVAVTAAEYIIKIVVKDGVFDSTRKSMWWFHKAARHKVVDGLHVIVCVLCRKHVQGKWEFNKRKGIKYPEASMPPLYQHDGARPHTALVNQRVLASHGKTKQFNLNVVVQPAQNPDLNVDDFNQRDLLNAIKECWKSYPAEKMNFVLNLSVYFIPRSLGKR